MATRKGQRRPGRPRRGFPSGAVVVVDAESAPYMLWETGPDGIQASARVGRLPRGEILLVLEGDDRGYAYVAVWCASRRERILVDSSCITELAVEPW